MLTHLSVYNYTLVNDLDLELHPGLTTLTGETGAGKSLLLDAIGLAIGNKAYSEAIHNPLLDAEVTATFDVRQQPKLQKWLSEQGLPSDQPECLLKRLITPQGRSRCFINGRTVTLNQLQNAGLWLVNIHGQHEHQALLNPNTQRRLLDTFGSYGTLTQAVQQHFTVWKNANDALAACQALADAQDAHYQLLKYQAEELSQLNLQPDEIEQLEQTQKQITNFEYLQQSCQNIVNMSRNNDDSVYSQLHSIAQQLLALSKHNNTFKEAHELIQTAIIHTQEATDNIDSYLQNMEGDSGELAHIEQRLSTLYTVARKHKITPEALYTHWQTLQANLASLQSSDEEIAELEAKRERALHSYNAAAQKLSDARKTTARKLCKSINEHLSRLNMNGAIFDLSFDACAAPSIHGNEIPQFLISTLPGKPPAALHKIASGGELSRIGLAIQVVTAAAHTTPTLIFDEVDAGIGGTTGDTVGLLLRELGSNAQVLCVTHLAQVASKAHHHLQVSKTISKGQALSSIKALKGDAIVAEIARMVGGPIDTDTSLAHARQMMAGS